MDRRIDPRGTARLLFEQFQGQAPQPFLDDLLANIDSAQEAGRSLAFLAYEVANLPAGLNAKEREALTLLLLAALLAMAQGSSRLPDDFAGELWQTLLPALLRNQPGGWTEESARGAMRKLLDDPRLENVIGQDAGAYKPLLHVDGCLYPQRMFRLEARVAEALRGLLARGAATFADAALQNAAAEVFAPDSQGRTLDPNQQYAALTALHMPLTVISGGPGTGKTTIVVAILRLLRRLQPQAAIALAAPTGKAAFRMKESIAAGLAHAASAHAADAALAEALPEPATLHRLLGASGDGRFFKHDAWNQLPYDVIVVDEASMIDLSLMDRLLRALPPHARIILLGDADQLPSVDAGAVLRDIVPAGFAAPQPWRTLVQGAIEETAGHADHPFAGCAVRLTKTHRQTSDAAGAAIRDLAALARDGRTGDLFAAGAPLVRRNRPASVTFEGSEFLPTAGSEDDDLDGQLYEFCERWYESQLREAAPLAAEPFELTPDGWTEESRARLDALFRHHERRKILCVSRVLPAGAQYVNQLLHGLFTRRARQAGSHGAPGEPVIMLRNDYEREIFNGDQGVVVATRNAEGVEGQAAVFRRGDRFVPIATAALSGGVELGYAMTVHKSQGSEFDHVALVLPRVDLPLATREIVYTAVTRAKRSVVILGAPEILSAAVGRRVTRMSGLLDRLRGPQS